jgi:hypothetical protein
VVAPSACGQAVVQLQGSLPFAFGFLGSAVQPSVEPAVQARRASVLVAERQSQHWQSTVASGVLALHWCVRHAPGQGVVGASRRLKSQSVGAAVSGGESFAVCARPLMHALRVSGRAARVTPRPLHRVMLNPSIERTRPGKPGRASHVKR